MLDFKEIRSGDEFELFCEDLLIAANLYIEKRPARGADGGCDLIATERIEDPSGRPESARWVVQCKHLAHAGRAVNRSDIKGYREALERAKTINYWLITSTLPSQTVEDDRIAYCEATKGKFRIWSINDLQRVLLRYPNIVDTWFNAASSSISAKNAVKMANLGSYYPGMDIDLRQTYREETLLQYDGIESFHTIEFEGLVPLNSIVAVSENTSYSLPDEIKQYEIVLLEHYRRHPRRRKPHRDPTARLAKLKTAVNESNGIKLEVHIQRVDYFAYIVSNYYCDLNLAVVGGNKTIRQILEPGPKLLSLPQSRCANQLGINCLLKTSDGFWIIPHKSDETHNHPNLLETSVSDACRLEPLFRTNLITSALLRSCQEELGIGIEEIDLSTFLLIGVLRELNRNGKPESFFVGTCKLTKEQVRRKFENGEPARCWQFDNITFVGDQESYPKLEIDLRSHIASPNLRAANMLLERLSSEFPTATRMH